MDVGPNFEEDRPASGHPESDEALPVDWFKGVQPLAEAAQGRVQRWLKRRAAALNGGPVLSVAELGDLIKQTEAALATALPGDAASLAVQLEDMHRELDTRTALGEDTTEWPRTTLRGHVVKELPG
jgi:hypothetical protein